ncbi:glycogen debranching protein [Actinomycetes bacterium KLBMP 9759]
MGSQRRSVTGTVVNLMALRRAAVTCLDRAPIRPSWDSAITAIGLARFDVPRALAELDRLLQAQQGTGMLPLSSTDGGLCAPPVHVIALGHVLARATEAGGSDLAAAEAFVEGSFDRWLAWHRWLARVRDPDGTGLLEIRHSVESGFDTSPRWDKPRAGAGEDTSAFRARDVFLSGIFAAANDVLAGIADELGRTDATAELHALAARFRAGVAVSVDPATSLARDVDVATGEWIATATVAGFAPLLAGGNRELAARQRTLLLGEDWLGHGALHYPLPPTVSPMSPGFRRRVKWHGPVSPIVAMLLGWASARDSAWDLRAVLADASVAQLGDLSFGEFYEPVTGEPLGARDHPPTAAVALEWLG